MGESPKVAVVTGSAKRLGAAIAIALACDGCDVVLHYRKSRNEADAVAKKIRKLGRRALLVKAELSRPAEVNATFRKIIKKFGKIDILVNNVGNYLVKNIRNLAAEEWKEQLDTTLNATFYCCSYALPYLRKSPNGRIINIGTSRIESLASRPMATAYQIGKTGILILTRSIAVAEARYSLTANVVSPGIIFNSKPRPKTPEAVPMKRFAQFDDVCNAVLFLVREESGYITGTNIQASGGYGV